MFKVLLLFFLFLLSCPGGILFAGNRFPDEPDDHWDWAAPPRAPCSYAEALQLWKAPDDLHGWIAANYRYDRSRAMLLSETRRMRTETVPIYHPSEFFDRKSGVCVDLARFAVETLRRIDPATRPKYLRIEFEPIQINGNTLRFHWLVSFQREEKFFFFADSSRPAHVAGPYENLPAFIHEYQRYRGRNIISFQQLDSYQKQRKIREKKKQASGEP